MNEALALTNLNTKKAVVENALKLLIRVKRQEKIRQQRGKLQWEGDLSAMRRDK